MTTVVIEKTCLLCGKPSSVEVNEARWAEYIYGLNAGLSAVTHGVHVLFPELTPAEREIIISGTHDACFNAAFAEDG